MICLFHPNCGQEWSISAGHGLVDDDEARRGSEEPTEDLLTDPAASQGWLQLQLQRVCYNTNDSAIVVRIRGVTDLQELNQ